jgi:hypothetical protein
MELYLINVSSSDALPILAGLNGAERAAIEKKIEERINALEGENLRVIPLKNTLCEDADECKMSIRCVCVVTDERCTDEAALKNDICDIMCFIFGLSDHGMKIDQMQMSSLMAVSAELSENEPWVSKDRIGIMLGIRGYDEYSRIADFARKEGEGYQKLIGMECVYDLDSAIEIDKKQAAGFIAITQNELKRLQREKKEKKVPMVYYGYYDIGLTNFMKIQLSMHRDEMANRYALMFMCVRPEEKWDYDRALSSIKQVLESNSPFLQNGDLIIAVPDFIDEYQDFYRKAHGYLCQYADEHPETETHLLFFGPDDESEDYKRIDREKFIAEHFKNRTPLYLGHPKWDKD